MAQSPIPRIRPHRTLPLLAGISLVILVPAALAAQMCEKPLCNDDERYVPGEGSDGARYGTCQRGPNWLGHLSHRRATCPDGFTLDPATGRCMDDGCNSGCGQTRPVCPYGTTFYRQEEGRDGPYALCRSASGLGYLSHQIVRCREGWRLTADGQCQRECVVARFPIYEPRGPIIVPRPDLVITDAYLRTRSSPARITTVPRNQPYLVCFTVANQGIAPSGAFRVEGGGLGVPTPPFQDHAGLAAGASRLGCLTYSTTPGPGSYVLGLTADSRNAVAESREDNNGRRVPVTVAP